MDQQPYTHSASALHRSLRQRAIRHVQLHASVAHIAQRVRWHVQHGGGSTTSQASLTTCKAGWPCPVEWGAAVHPPPGRVPHRPTSRRWQRSWRPSSLSDRKTPTPFGQKSEHSHHSCGGDGRSLALYQRVDCGACGDWERQTALSRWLARWRGAAAR